MCLFPIPLFLFFVKNCYLNIVDLDNVGQEIKEDYNFAYNLLNKAHAFREDEEDE